MANNKNLFGENSKEKTEEVNIQCNENVKNVARDIFSNNAFETVLESLMNELPSKDALQQYLTSNDNRRGSITNFHSKIMKESSIYISCFEDQLSGILACKRYESGHAVANLSSFTLSYARAFYANALASLQTEIRISDHKREWKEISEGFTKEAARKYVDYLDSQTKFLNERSKDLEVGSSSMTQEQGSSSMIQEQKFQTGDDVNNNIVSHDFDATQTSTLNSQRETHLFNSSTPNVKENITAVSTYDCTPNFEPCTPTAGRMARKRVIVKSPSVTPVVLQASNLSQTSMTSRNIGTTKQFSKKKLNFSSDCINNEGESVFHQATQLKRLTRCPKRVARGTVKQTAGEDKALLKPLNDESKRGKKIYVSTFISDKNAGGERASKKGGYGVLTENEGTEWGAFSESVSPTSISIVDTPVKRKEQLFTSPQSPPRKRLIFSSSPLKSDSIEPRSQNRIHQDWKLAFDIKEENKFMTKSSSHIKVLTINAPEEASCKSSDIAGENSGKTLTPIGKRIGSFDEFNRPEVAEKTSESVMSPTPYMPRPSLWAPRKAKRTPSRYRLPLCRRSLIRQFQGLSVNHQQFMDTPPGSPGSFEPLPLLD